jgi:legumain
VAGSRGYDNYRHQADASHAYQLVRNNGIPKSNIITFLYNDIANNTLNPFPGQIFNAPTTPGHPGHNEYQGLQLDYQGDMLTPDNFLAVLAGNSSALPKGSKVLNSGPNDRVFIFFTDHGAPGLIMFPDDALYASDLMPVLQSMHEQKRYSRMVFYLEAVSHLPEICAEW